MTKHTKCSGVSLTGYWKGYPCGTSATIQDEEGKWWCALHYAINLTNPERFEKLKERKNK